MTESIFLYFSKEKLMKMLSSFHHCTQLPIRILDMDGADMLSAVENTDFFSTVRTLFPQRNICSRMDDVLLHNLNGLKKSTVITVLGSVNCLAVPFTRNHHQISTILIGPFFLNTPDAYLAADLLKESDAAPQDVIRLHESLKTVRVIPQSLLTDIEDLVSFLFHYPDQNDTTISVEEKNASGYFQEYMDSSSYPYEKEQLLISQIKSENIQEANAVLNDLLGYVLFSGNGSLDTAKARAIELCCVLSRVTIENGATTSGVLNFNNECIKSIQTVTDLYSLGDQLLEITEVFISSIQQQQQKIRNELIQSAENYITSNYTKTITLEDLADYVHLNPSYFSSLFKQTTGTSFKSYLNIIRIENSKKLLFSSDMTLIQVASAVGFQDYNYFSRVFKKLIGMTPSQYRDKSRYGKCSL